MPTLVIMVGCPGSGKDWTIMNHKFFEHLRANVVSRDVIRFGMLKEGDDYFKNEKKVYKTFISEIVRHIDAGEHVVANATHLNKVSRRKLINAIDAAVANKNYEIVIFHVDPDVSVAIEQNNRRSGLMKVPEDVIRNMWNSMDMPAYEEDDRITTIYKTIGNGKLYRRNA